MDDMPQPRSTTRWPALILLLSGIGGALVMAFHPAAQGVNAEARLHGLVTISALSRHVHMAMIAFVISVWFALAYLARQLPSSGRIWLAVRLYSVGASAMLGAALISGFIIGGYLQRVLRTATAAQDALPSVLLAFSANQVLAGLGTLLTSAAITIWSMDMVRMHSSLGRACGVYGIGMGAACVLAYAMGFLSLDVAGMSTVVAAHGVWYFLLAITLLRRSHSSRTMTS